MLLLPAEAILSQEGQAPTYKAITITDGLSQGPLGRPLLRQSPEEAFGKVGRAAWSVLQGKTVCRLSFGLSLGAYRNISTFNILKIILYVWVLEMYGFKNLRFEYSKNIISGENQLHEVKLSMKKYRILKIHI